LGLSQPLWAKVIYVDATAVGSNNGSSWQNAYIALRNALTTATAGDQIRVAQGTYRPDQGTGITAGSRVATFQIKTGVAVKGGYAGLSQVDPNSRDSVPFETILSGDLKGDDAAVADPCQLWTDPTRSDNAYNVVTLTNADSATLLDGLTITAGLESRSGNPRGDGGPGGGGGMVVSSGNPTLIRCTFRDNAGRSGGGLLITTGTPTLTGCTFVDNFSFTDGGAMICKGGTTTLQGCTISGNKAGSSGGAIAIKDSGTLSLKSCSLTGNTSGSGGGIFNDRGTLTCDRCVLAGNSAASIGGGIGTTVSFSPSGASGKASLIHCVLVGNKAQVGSAIDYPSVASNIQVFVAHSILWGNMDPGTFADLSTVGALSYCCVQPGLVYHDGGGNISADPLFAKDGSWDATGQWVDGDYHLQSQAGRWDPVSKAWVRDPNTSPCIDAGNLVDPIGPEPFPNGGIVNLGLYGGTEEASKSYFGKTPCDTIVAGDVTGDCKVDAQDLAIMAMHWLENRQEKVQIKWLGHAAFKVWTSSVVIYIDPYQITDTPRDATYILCSHTHGDHYSTGDITKVAGPGMQLIGPPDVVASYGKGLTLAPGQTLTLGNLTVTGVRAYNTNKSNHPKSSNWLGFVVELAGKRIYHAGDTDLIEEMKSLKEIDVAMLPVGATYTMNATEAVTATTYIRPNLAIPMHWNNTTKDTLTKTLVPNAACPVKIMTAGESFSL
jgi:L-ascorbate metabolism protein UlaG (beta-lactamase superfamily)